MDVRRSRTKDTDEWITTCPEASRPICEALREMIFRWEPDLEESINTNMLCYSGRKRIVALGGFKHKACVTFFRGAELDDPKRLFNHGENNASIRNIMLTTLEAFPHQAFKALLHAAVAFDAQPDAPPPPSVKREPMPIPPQLAQALKKDRAAAAFFETLKPTYQREYIAWNTFAKLPETKAKRLAETMAALAAGKKWAQRREAR